MTALMFDSESVSPKPSSADPFSKSTVTPVGSWSYSTRNFGIKGIGNQVAALDGVVAGQSLEGFDKITRGIAADQKVAETRSLDFLDPLQRISTA